ncbi:MAG: NAD(P)H-hydrate dehydratase [Planctomycetaceae bacterium]|nr:NAD(P)H-hydrate dehydratase [Planctomycetales bacterium]MCB9926994.1 NAD(P)H-hydrate dehydratase [Planctomycetaceae bacterium]
MADSTTNTMSELPILPKRAIDSHKGNYGKVLLVGGSRGMTGAIALAGMACLRSGAGLVTLAVPEVCLDVVASFEPSYMTVPLPCDEQGRLSVTAQEQLADLADRATCIACGPGLGRTQRITDLVAWMYEVLPQPIVFDADALYALSERHDRLDDPAGPRILTPHLGEFRHLVGDDEIGREKAELFAAQLAIRRHVVLLLKGHNTVVTDGRRSSHNSTGNPGMATGGSGDVLTGVIAALIGQGLAPFEAARLGAYVHGLAGDLAAAQLGTTSLIASDIVAHLPAAFLSLDQLA